MSLHKKLWLAIIALLLLVFSGSFLVSMLSAKSYLEQQLSMKNADNAAALALSLTQQGADEVLLELTLAAQFDTGFYQMIEMSDPEGRRMIHREDAQQATAAPGWFINLFPMAIEDGVAQVQDGWTLVGTLTLRSHSRFAYDRLWDNSKLLAAIFLAAMVVSGLLGGQILKRILRPLDDVVRQARAIGERRFITIDEPSTLEFRQVVAAMNELSARIKTVLAEEAKRLQKWQRDAHVDRVSGLNNREPFMAALSAALESDDVNATGSLSLIRLSDLVKLNQDYGRVTIDKVIREIGNELNQMVVQRSRWSAGRLNGSDFAILAPRAIDPVEAARQARDAIERVMDNHNIERERPLPAATTLYHHGDTIATVMTRLDGALQANEEDGNGGISTAYDGDAPRQPLSKQLEEWRGVFDKAFAEKMFTLVKFPAVDLDNKLLHQESMVRLQWDGRTLAAGEFLPWINRLEMSSDLDRAVINMALREIREGGEPVCVNLSVASVVEPGFIPWVNDRLSAHKDITRLLWLELPEPMAFRHLENFRKLAGNLKNYGCKVGIEHVGHQLAELGELHDIGIDYLKIDASFVRGIDDNVANQTLLRTLCTVGHSIGVAVYAEGVRTEEEWEALKGLGADGAAGPGVRLA